MATAWEKFEELVKQELRKIYSETAIEHSMNPRNLGGLEGANGYGEATGTCGDTMKIWIKVKDDIVHDASFTTDGCSTTLASGSMITELAKGKSIGEAYRINQQDVLNALEGLPEESQHCALLASDTLKIALKDYLSMKRDPWKRAYRK